MLISADGLRRIDAAAVCDVTRDALAACPYVVTIGVAGDICAIGCGSAAAAACFNERYVDLVRTGHPDYRAFVLEHPVHGWMFWSSPDMAWHWPHGSLTPDVVAFLADAVALTLAFEHRTDGIISLHAAAVGVAGGAAAIIAESNGGKSTTAVACARAAMDVFSDERCLIDRNGIVYPFPRTINLRSGGVRLLAEDTAAGSDAFGAALRDRGTGDWNGIRLTDLTALGIPAPRPLRAVFTIAGTNGVPLLEPVPWNVAARQAARWTHGAGSRLDRVSRLMRQFAGISCYRLHLGAPHATALAVRQTLLHLSATAPASA